ncbi:MAG: hypothetical protein F4Y63_07500 [Chloroflexi bacterium]|nr:hypothetical protein [Chloroflexota bacterium]MYF79336.1 hypothetical protein [Chloroflexota bacterium]MYK62407.1 hypothetical protein [Chloroflexota bacterium]
MTIIRDGRNATAVKDFAIVGVGGAGARTASELSRVLGNPDDVIAVDREMDDLRLVNVGRRISIGYPMFTRETGGIEDDEYVDKNDLFRLKTLIGKAPIVFVLAGLGGATTVEILPAVLRTAMSTGATVLAIVTMPFAFEGRTRSNTAGVALQRVRNTGCSLALIDGDNALSSASIAGDLASELSAAKARVVMNVLSASNAESSGTLNSAPELLDAIKCGGETLISYAASEDVSEYRKVARDAIKTPITSGLDLSDADFVSVIVAGPHDMSIKVLNSAIAVVQKELPQKAVLSTSFIPNGDSRKANRLRISILAGMRAGTEEIEAESPIRADVEQGFNLVGNESCVPIVAEPAGDVIDDLFGAPDWLVDRPSEKSRVPALL